MNSPHLITNDLKAQFAGEFEFKIDAECAECLDAGADEDCEVCQGQVTYHRTVTVPWTVTKDIFKQMYAARFPEATPTAPKALSSNCLRVGNLPTFSDEEYPGLPDWWVQLWHLPSDTVFARVYGDTPEAAREHAKAIAENTGHSIEGRSANVIKRLLESAEAVRDDLLARAEPDFENDPNARVVNVSDSKWQEYKAAIKDARAMVQQED